ncbi:MAG: hypothetical protein ACKV2V_00395 [Blastocatellia bacterium]
MKFLKQLWEGWKKFGHIVGNFMARLQLTVLYFAVLLPFGIGVRLIADSLHIKRPPQKWLDQKSEAVDLAWARRQW